MQIQKTGLYRTLYRALYRCFQGNPYRANAAFLSGEKSTDTELFDSFKNFNRHLHAVTLEHHENREELTTITSPGCNRQRRCLIGAK